MSLSTSLIDPPALWNNQIVQSLKTFAPIQEVVQSIVLNPVPMGIPNNFVNGQTIGIYTNPATGFSTTLKLAYAAAPTANSVVYLPQPTATNALISLVNAAPNNPPPPNFQPDQGFNLTLVGTAPQNIISVPTTVNTAYVVKIKTIAFNVTDSTSTVYNNDLGVATQLGNLLLPPTYATGIVNQDPVNPVVTFATNLSAGNFTIVATGTALKTIKCSFLVSIISTDF